MPPRTMREIALTLGLSQQTVSLALGPRAHLLRPETRERVLAAVRRAGYRPHGSALALRRNRFGCVALLQSTTGAYSYMPRLLWDGLHEVLAEHDLHLTTARLTDEQIADEGFVPKILRQRMADGMLIDYIQDIPQRLVRQIERYHIPSIWINARRRTDCVRPDDRAGGYQAVEQLRALGHRRIAFYHYTWLYSAAYHYSVAERRAGYAQAMRAASLRPMVLENTGPVGREAAMATVVDWLRKPDRPTAVITYNERLLELLLLAAARCGLRIPEDLSIISFGGDAVDIGGQLIATMQLPLREMARAAVEMLLAKIADPRRPLPARVLPLQYRAGNSVGPPAENAPRKGVARGS